MNAVPSVWILRLCWLLLPFTLGDALSATLDDRSAAVAVTTAALGWAVWAAVLTATMIPRPVTLTLVRILTPVAVAAGVAMAIVGSPTGSTPMTEPLGLVGLVAAIGAVAAALSATTADWYVDGASYGDEARFALRSPASFLIGPIPVFWLVLVGGLIGGPILVSAHQWILGGIAVAAGLVVTKIAIKSFHSLSLRWLVFVPAGTTLIDHLVLVDPALLPKRRITHMAPAVEGTAATDLTSQAPGLVLELAFDSPIEIVARTSRDEGEVQLVSAVLITPGRPGAVLAEAARRGLRTSLSNEHA